jgi:hypothetical protein
VASKGFTITANPHREEKGHHARWVVREDRNGIEGLERLGVATPDVPATGCALVEAIKLAKCKGGVEVAHAIAKTEPLDDMGAVITPAVDPEVGEPSQPVAH